MEALGQQNHFHDPLCFCSKCFYYRFKTKDDSNNADYTRTLPIIMVFLVFVAGPPGDDRQSVAMKDLLDAIYPRSDQPEYVVRLEPIQTTNKAVLQFVTTEEELARYPSHTPSARESPVAWEGGDPVEGVDNNQANQPGAAESHSSTGHNQGQRRWEAEEETKEEQPQAEDEGSNSGVGDNVKMSDTPS